MATQVGEQRKATKASVRPLQEPDLQTADHIFRLAFGTFLGLPNPMAFFEGADYVRTRYVTDPDAAFAAEIGGEIVGSNFATNWGSVGFFGPLTVRPDLWAMGIGTQLMEPVIDVLARWDIKHAGLFTWPQSAKHTGLYQKFGFWARYLTAIMEKPVPAGADTLPPATYSDLAESEQDAVLDACRELTDAIYEGLDLEGEIRAVEAQGLGDTVLLLDGSKVAGLAVCHCGAGTEAGPDACFIKFGAVRPGKSAAEQFERLLDACEQLTAARGLSRLVAGANMARHDAYRRLLARGFRTWLQGVAMEKPNEPGYNRPDVYLIDDWR
jgi:GNAT superfamily N-acetyltransferase